MRLFLLFLLLAVANSATCEIRVVPLDTHFNRLLQSTVPRVVTITEDPVFQSKGNRRYGAYPLGAVLSLLSIKAGPDTAIGFRCRDGYRAVVVLAEVDVTHAFLASEEASAPYDKWSAIPHGKDSVAPGPYMLIWSGQRRSTQEAPWPYAVTALEIGSIQDFFGHTFPPSLASKASSDVRKGFTIFRTSCMSCHSLNLSGGAIGPELNVPKNITEYWNRADLIGFIKNPQSYRWRSKMMIEGLKLSDQDIENVVSYLEAMRGHKVCDSSKSCGAFER